MENTEPKAKDKGYYDRQDEIRSERLMVGASSRLEITISATCHLYQLQYNISGLYFF
jgi:hypothetical protein